MLVDDWEARAKKLKVGDTYNLLNHDWKIAAIVEHGKGSRIFVPILTLQELVGARDKASIFLLKCTRPEHTDDVMDEIKAIFPGYTIRPLSAVCLAAHIDQRARPRAVHSLDDRRWPFRSACSSFS